LFIFGVISEHWNFEPYVHIATLFFLYTSLNTHTGSSSRSAGGAFLLDGSSIPLSLRIYVLEALEGTSSLKQLERVSIRCRRLDS
jgi:hypothetical protein